MSSSIAAAKRDHQYHSLPPSVARVLDSTLAPVPLLFRPSISLGRLSGCISPRSFAALFFYAPPPPRSRSAASSSPTRPPRVNDAHAPRDHLSESTTTPAMTPRSRACLRRETCSAS